VIAVASSFLLLPLPLLLLLLGASGSKS